MDINIFERIPIIRTFYRIAKIPVRIKTIRDELATLHGKIDELASLHGKIDELATLHGKIDELATLHGKIDELKLLSVIYANDNIILKKIRDFYFCIPSEDYKLLLHLLYGNPEPGLDKFIIKNLKNDDVFVDIGAHIGLVTLRAASIIGLKGKVYAFEPTPRINKILKHNIHINNFTGIVEIFPLAISNKKGKNKLYQYEIYGHNTLFPYSNGDTFVEVDVDTLDNILGSVSRIDMIKIDAEGAEPFVLEGMKEIIMKNPGLTIIIEFGPGHFIRNGIDPLNFITSLMNDGFNIRQIKEPSGEVIETSVDYLLNAFSENIILFKGDRKYA